MKSRWFESKPVALKLRKKGLSIRNIEKSLHIPRSTLSGWFKNVQLSLKQKYILNRKRLKSLKEARKHAVKWHNLQKEQRLIEAENKATEILNQIDYKNPLIQEFALAMLYLGEGSKTKSGTGIGNSDPLILKFFIKTLLKNQFVDISKIKCALHLRADQNPEILKTYWSKELDIPLKNFTSPSLDIRTKGHPTYPTYRGVCVVQCGNIALQRKWTCLSRKFCERIVGTGG